MRPVRPAFDGLNEVERHKEHKEHTSPPQIIVEESGDCSAVCARAVCYIKGCAQRRRTLCAHAEGRGKGRRRRRRGCEEKKNKAREK